MSAPSSYKTVLCGGEKETVVNKSRFICYLRHAESAEQAEEEINAIRKKHPSATHVCYGCIADVSGDLFRYGDDGEPVGTAGQPILGVLRGENLRQTLAAVVRYFGGIKLGTGGLARAYGDSVKNALCEAEIKTFEKKAVYEISMSYTEYNAVVSSLEKLGAKTVSQEFGENVLLELAFNAEENAESVLSGLLQRECKTEKTGERYV